VRFAPVQPVGKVASVDPAPALDRHEPGMGPRGFMMDAVDAVEVRTPRRNGYTPEIPVHMTGSLHAELPPRRFSTYPTCHRNRA
jgi:hypothetical protein